MLVIRYLISGWRRNLLLDFLDSFSSWSWGDHQESEATITGGQCSISSLLFVGLGGFLASISFVLALVENQYPTESYHSEIFTIEILLQKMQWSGLHVRLVNDIQLVKTEEQPQGKFVFHGAQSTPQISPNFVAQCCAVGVPRHPWRNLLTIWWVYATQYNKGTLANQYCGDFQ